MKHILKLRRNCLALGIRRKVSWNLSLNAHGVFYLATLGAGPTHSYPQLAD